MRVRIELCEKRRAGERNPLHSLTVKLFEFGFSKPKFGFGWVWVPKCPALVFTIMGHFNRLGTLFYANSICFQFIGTIFFHLLAAMTTSRIHQNVKQLSGLMVSGFHFSLKFRLKCAHYIFKFQSKKYGITYGSPKYGFGLISMVSFTKFVLMYLELIMLSFKIGRQKEKAN